MEGPPERQETAQSAFLQEVSITTQVPLSREVSRFELRFFAGSPGG